MEQLFSRIRADNIDLWLSKANRMACSNRTSRRGLLFAMLALACFSTFQPTSAVVLPNKTQLNDTHPLTGTYESCPFAQGYSALMLGYYFANASVNGESKKPHDRASMHQLLYAERSCPKKLQLDVHNVSSLLKFNLTAPESKCVPSPYLTWPTLLLDFGRSMGSFFLGSMHPTYVDNRRILFSASAKDLLKCSNASFSTLSIFSLAQQSLSVLYSHLQEFGIPHSATEHIFGRLNHQTIQVVSRIHSHWNSLLVEEAKVDIRKQFSEFGSVPLLALGHRKGASSPLGPQGECFYVKDGDPSANKTKKNLIELLQKMVPIIMTSVLKPLKHTVTSLHLADPKCGSSSGTVFNHIEISPIREHFDTSYEGVLKSTVEIDGVRCGAAESVRLLEAESTLKDDALGRKALFYAEKLKPLFEMKKRSKLASELYLEEKAPEEFVEDLQEAIFKSKLVVMKVDVSKCDHVQDKQPVGLVVVDLPPAKFCENITLPSANKICKELESGVSAFLTRPKLEEKVCLYSSKKPMRASKTPGDPKHSSPSHPSRQPGHRHPTRPPHQDPHQPPSHAPPFVPPADHPTHRKPAPKIPKYPGLSSNSFWACFPGEALVALSDGRRVSMENLRVGDMVEFSPNTFSPVLLFTHAVQDITTRMVIIESASGKLAASPTHYIHVNQTLVTAKDVKVGDFIYVKVNEQLCKEPVTKISFKHLKGLYNPQTKSGKILVQYGNAAPVVASAYTSAVKPFVAHILMTPLRWTHSLFGLTIPGVSNLFPETSVEKARGADCIDGGSSVPVMNSHGIAAAWKIIS